MLKTLLQLLGEDAPKFRRYVSMAVIYGLLSGLTIISLVPLLRYLLVGDISNTVIWLVVLLTGVLVCWRLRLRVEKAGIEVGIAILQGGRHRLGNHISQLPVGWFNSNNTARLSHVIFQGVMAIAQLPAHVFTPVFSSAMTPLIIVLSLFTINWKMGLIALLSIPLMGAVFIIAARLGQRVDQEFHRNTAETSQRIIEFSQAQSVLRAFNGEGKSTHFLEQAFDSQKKSSKRLILLSVISVILNAWMVQAIFATLMITALLSLNNSIGVIPTDTNNSDTLISIIISLLLVNRFVEPLLDVVGYAEAIRGARNQLKEVQDIFDIEPLPEPENPKFAQDNTLSLNGVGFAYPDNKRHVIRDVNLSITPGSMTALIGRSGSGKSTLLSLITRFSDVTEGSITMGGVDLRQMSHEQLNEKISQVFQTPYLFQSSIADNIRIGKPDASDAEIREVARLSGVTEIIGRLPQGVDTLVGEGGARLSGGERQRISIARALMKDAPILLIDEATAALDTENQAVITQTFARLRGKRTLIVITHQLSTIEMADQIVILERGCIKEKGSHDQLSISGGLYAHFLAQRNKVKRWKLGKL
ncbi:ABC transporter ATP-binding protein [Marinomonas sp. RSW2]|uniref:ABC transporter ATP-binding protein n=1 Tax=Marinomonas maritima TaxID=2940935 RepID=A0ABT5WFN0_9GAMM|nr:ABC transporter ATP-binding protein [Marinomonas maritima]MDE8603618.1 ABC transporter ATP-binding protein [Marinomonas maritima]